MTGNRNTAAYWLESAAKRFVDAGLHFGHGTDNAHDEAAWLVLSALGEPLDSGFSNWNRRLTSDEETLLTDMLAQRIRDFQPAAYITGTTLFAGLEFEVDDTVLVPRSPIAELIPDQFSPWVQPRKVNTVLDLCTGNGCIAIACGFYMPRVTVDAADFSESALAVARRNVQRHSLEGRVRIVHSDLFEALAGSRYDLIVTNPPYVPMEEWSNLPAEYHAEPAHALVSGPDGLDAVLKILQQAADFLTEEGILVCEVGESEQSLVTLLPEIPFIWVAFSHGGSGVFVLGRQQLCSARDRISQLLMNRNEGVIDVP
jgi:ribosomal protein L3 glutamine methyltransferase